MGFVAGNTHFKNKIQDFDLGMGRKTCYADNFTLFGDEIINVFRKGIDYELALYGRIDNKEEMIRLLESLDIETDEDSYLVDLYLQFGYLGFKKLEGSFAIAIMNSNGCLLVRDHLGLCSLFYTIKDDEIYFSSDLSELIKTLDIHEVDTNGVCELIGMGPSHSRGKTVYKDVFRLDGGEYLYFNGKVKKGYYFDFSSEELNITYEEAKQKIKELLEESYEKMKEGNSCLLSGGLDSSIVLSMLGKSSKTYTINYLNNEFKEDSFLVSDDTKYVGYMIDEYQTIHQNIDISVDELIDNLERAVDLRGYPGMADIDTSLLVLLEKIPDVIIYTGECSDEIFSGYPWCYRDSKALAFPWLRNLDIKEEVVNEKYRGLIKDYIIKEYQRGVESSRVKDEKKIINYLNLKYFLTNLLERQERMAIGANKDLRSPFGSYKLANLLFNLPFSYKYDGSEKRILRDIYKDKLPALIVERKKSPYPKIKNHEFFEKIKAKLHRCLLSKDSLLYELFDMDKVLSMSDFDVPWYGQLMTLPSFYAYLYQIDYWGRKYQIKL